MGRAAPGIRGAVPPGVLARRRDPTVPSATRSLALLRARRRAGLHRAAGSGLGRERHAIGALALLAGDRRRVSDDFAVDLVGQLEEVQGLRRQRTLESLRK